MFSNKLSKLARNNINYLRELSDDYNVPIDTVVMLADMLGENELYDGLITELEDYQYLQVL
jgi:hypothetical protein